MKITTIISFLLVFSSYTGFSIGWKSQQIDSGWKLKQIAAQEHLTASVLKDCDKMESKDWIEIARMPAMVHDILIDNKIIEEPWLPNRADSCKWVAEADWLYAVNFNTQQAASTFLNFLGLDTNVDIYLNGKLIGSNSNMHLPLRIDVTGQLKPTNSLVIHFHSVFKRVGEKLEIVNQFRGNEVRRSTHNYDNYLGANPYLSRVGVYDAIFLEYADGNELADVVIGASLNNELNEGKVQVEIIGKSKIKDSSVQLTVFGPDKKIVVQEIVPVVSKNGEFNLKSQLSVKNPALWWPRGQGDQPLYEVEAALIAQNKQLQMIKKKVGFREIKQNGHLHFVINHKPILLLGANFVTPHWHTAVWDQQRVDDLFRMSANAHFNTLRTWADVEAPRDAFYEMADSLGFLVWNDLPQLYQAWQMPNVTPTEKTRQRILSETAYWVKKLKHHPSIFLWCGGNEEPLWNDPKFNGFDNRGPWAFEAISKEVGEVCHSLDSARFFLPTSPYNKTEYNDPASETHGYTHLWFIPGYDYINFASEDTRIAAPTINSLKKMMAPEDLWPENYIPPFTPDNRVPFPKTWLKYAGEGSSFRKTGPIEQFYDPTDAESVVQRMGMAECLYYQQTIERQRRGRPADDTTTIRRCGGYLVWKLNDSWPQIYSAKIDYFMEPYHAYYAIRRAFQPVMLSFEIGNYIWLWAINDSPNPVEGTINIQLFHLERNKVHQEITRKVTILPGESKVVIRLDEAGIGLFRREHILSASLSTPTGEIIARTTSLTDIERHIAFPDAKLNVKVIDGSLEITTDKFAHTVCLEGDANGEKLGWFFEDNYFDVMPGEKKMVKILGKHKAGLITAKPWYSKVGSTIKFNNL
jgi:beta-galactosidase/beta-glucuronidase